MSTPVRPTLKNHKFWHIRRAHYLAVFRKALLLLRDSGPLPEDEPNLNRELQFVVRTACRLLDPNGIYGHPMFEAQKLPDPDANTMQPHDYKVPDITWTYDDPVGPDDRYGAKSFIVECKRLGVPSSPTWKLNEQYVISGIERFRSPDFRYGMYMSEGLMIGYVQTMSLAAAHSEVCQHAGIQGFPALTLSNGGWQSQGVSELEHTFPRTFPSTPFLLTHFWLDVQDIPVRPAPPPPAAQTITTKARRTRSTQSPRKRNVRQSA